jgi:putative CocE/NonD family hydrolase
MSLLTKHDDGDCPLDDFDPLPAWPDVGWPTDESFEVSGGEGIIRLQAHYWCKGDPNEPGRKKCPAIVEFNPYRRRDGTMYADSKMYPWFAYNDYVCFRVDLQGSGDSEGVLKDEYTNDELSYCVQVIEQIAKHRLCMMGKSWSAINALMVAARDDCPTALRAVVFCAGTDDRYNDDVHYMGGAQMFDNFSWASSMWRWLAAPPDPEVAPDWLKLWDERIKKAGFWFQQWAEHQTRDAYWSETSVRSHYDKVNVPVHVISGWWDGYKNPILRVLTELGKKGRTVSGIIGPWGHKYPFDGYPRPNVDWLSYIVTHWWDRWLKGTAPDPSKEWPELAVWLGKSREPSATGKPCYVEDGEWVSENSGWEGRVKDLFFYLDQAQLSELPPTAHNSDNVPLNPCVGLSMLETSSWGDKDSADLPGDQSKEDAGSLTFTGDELPEDLPCFGYPRVQLNLDCKMPLASVAIRLCEVSPTTGASNLVSYRFFNLCYPKGDMAPPQKIPSGVFSMNVPLNAIGHIFESGWRLRLSISPSFFPTLWQSPELPDITVHTGPVDGLKPSALILPVRAPLEEDKRAAALLPDKSAYVDPANYVPLLPGDGKGERKTERTPTCDGNRVEVHKSGGGSTTYGGPLKGLTVTYETTEDYQITKGDPLSYDARATSDTTMERPGWRAQSITETHVSSKSSGGGQSEFHYKASVRTFLNGQEIPGPTPVEGTVQRVWI